MNEIFQNITLIILIIIPTPLLLLKIWDKIFIDTKVHDLKTICLGANRTLLKNYYQIKSIYFDNFTIKIKNNNKYEITDRKEPLKKLQSFSISQNEIIEIMAFTTNIATFKKLNQLEEAVISFFNKNSLSKSLIERKYREIDRVEENNLSKISSKIVKKNETNEIFAFSKGNPYKILEKCTRIIINGKKEEITPNIRHKLKKQISKLNKNGKKVISYAFRPLPLKKLDKYTSEFTEKEMIFLGFIAVKKPLNRESEVLIKKLKEKGLRILLITQLNEKNAVAIAKELNIINQKHFEAITGDYFKTLNEQKKEKIMKEKDKDYIFCEIKGKEKNEIISRLNTINEKVLWINKKYSLENTLKKIDQELIFKKNKLLKNYLSLFFRPILLLLLILSFIFNIQFPLHPISLLILDILIVFPQIIIFRKETLNSSLSKIKIITDTIIFSILLSLGVFYFFKTRGITLSSSFNLDESLLKSISSFFIIFISLVKLLNIFNIINWKNSKNKFLLSLTIITIVLLTLISTPIIRDFISINLLDIKETILISSLLGIYLSTHFLRLSKNA